MKKKLLILMFITIGQTMAQDVKILKLHPFSLVTGMLSVSQENFSKDNKKSLIIGLGVRYLNRKEDIANSYSSSLGVPYSQFNSWKGVNVSIERRYYVPGFNYWNDNPANGKKTRFGIYFSAGSKFDFNNNDYDKSSFGSVPSKNDPNKYVNELVSNTGKLRYLGVMPNLNIGMQFTLFQNLYTDLQLGGGIRFIDKKVIRQKKDLNSYSYSNVNATVAEHFITREGVQPNFSFGFGINVL